VNDNNLEDMGLSPEMQDEIEAQTARQEESDRVRAILEMRPKRMERGFWRELWSFVIAD
jgi:amino acid transporter